MNGVEFRKAGPRCPRCDSDLVLREGKYGGYYGCVMFPDCRYTHSANQQLAVQGVAPVVAPERPKAPRTRNSRQQASLLPPLPETPYVPKHPSEVGLVAPACNPNWEVRGSDKLPWE